MIKGRRVDLRVLGRVRFHFDGLVGPHVTPFQEFLRFFDVIPIPPVPSPEPPPPSRIGVASESSRITPIVHRHEQPVSATGRKDHVKARSLFTSHVYLPSSVSLQNGAVLCQIVDNLWRSLLAPRVLCVYNV